MNKNLILKIQPMSHQRITVQPQIEEDYKMPLVSVQVMKMKKRRLSLLLNPK